MSSRRPSQFETGAAVVLMVNGMTGSVRQTTMNDLRLDYGLRVLEPAAGQPDSGQGSDTSPPSPRLPPGHTHGDHDIDEAISPLQLSQVQAEDSLSVDVLAVPQTPWPEKDPAPGPHVRSNWRPGAWTWVGYGADPKSEPLAMRGANSQLQAQTLAADLQPQEQAGPQSTRLQRSPGLRPADMLAPTHGSPIYRTKQHETDLAKMVNLLGIGVLLAVMMSGVAFAMMFVNFPLAWPSLTSAVGKDFVKAATTSSLRLQWDRVGGGNDAEGYSLYIRGLPLLSEVTLPPVDVGNASEEIANFGDLQMSSKYKVEIWKKPLGGGAFSQLLYEGTYVTGSSETRLSVNVSALYAGPVSPPYTVTLRWDGGSLAERLYKVSPAQLGSSLVEYEAVGLEPGRPYRGEIWAVRADGEERLAYLFMAKTSSQ
ncbi:uncharacterized protein LOC144912575 [Branchiostoma floridae x Branchiostoma belcheri]